MFNFPVPKTTLGKAAERAVVIAVVAGLGYLLQDPAVGQGGLAYFIVKTIYDLLNSNIKNV